jgi:membrane associated rhomboid family serine protease
MNFAGLLYFANHGATVIIFTLLAALTAHEFRQRPRTSLVLIAAALLMLAATLVFDVTVLLADRPRKPDEAMEANMRYQAILLAGSTLLSVGLIGEIIAIRRRLRRSPLQS